MSDLSHLSQCLSLNDSLQVHLDQERLQKIKIKEENKEECVRRHLICLYKNDEGCSMRDIKVMLKHSQFGLV